MRANWSSRKSPSDLDEPPRQLEKVVEFDCRQPWPERWFGQRFGPSLIDRALKAGFYVLCELADTPPDWPPQWAVDGARWQGEVLEIHCLHGWRIPTRIWTTNTLKGMRF